MVDLNMVPISCSQLAGELQQSAGDGPCRLLLVDTRPSAQHCNKHITGSENVNFSNILLRRLLKGVVQLSTLLGSKDLSQRLARRDSEQERLVVYDSCSKCDCIRTELCKHAQVLASTDMGKQSDNTVYFLDGGLEQLSAEYPHLCSSSSPATKKAHSPLGISVSASLPLFNSQGQSKRQYSKLQTPSEDTSSQFGPPVEILPHLVLGCAKDSGNLTQLRKHGVTAVLNVSHNCPNHFESLLEYKCIPVQDSYQADLLSKMESAIEYINSIRDKNGCTFVHCHAGISRSATICIAYIMKSMQMDLAGAYEFVKEKRPCISPNLHFMGQLLEFQKQLQAEVSMDQQSSGDESADGEVDMSMCCSSTSSVYYDVTLHESISPLPEEAIDCETTRPNSVLSASAPSSLKLEDNEPTPRPEELMITSTQVFTGITQHRTPIKPKSLPLKKSISVQEQPVMEKTVAAALPPMCADSYFSCKEKQLLHSISLPSTPILAQYQNHLRGCHTPSPLPPYSSASSTSPHPRSLQHSPCRVVASLGSRSETSLNYHLHSPLGESN